MTATISSTMTRGPFLFILWVVISICPVTSSTAIHCGDTTVEFKFIRSVITYPKRKCLEPTFPNISNYID